jgi:hypothetical protein
MATVKDLIKQLQEIEDQDQTIIFQYYTADMLVKFSYDETEHLTQAQMKKLAERVDDCDNFYDDVWEGLMEFIGELDFEADEEEEVR